MHNPAAVLVFAALAVCVACGSDDKSTSLPDGSPSSASVSPMPTETTCVKDALGPPGVAAKTMNVAGVARPYTLALPESSDNAPAPLLVAFMPAGDDATPASDDLRMDAVAGGFIVALPQASEDGWNPADTADERFANDLVASLRESGCIDSVRIYLVGFADGATMAQSLACANPHVVAAIAMVAAAYLPCSADLPLLAVHGSADVVIPYEGGVIAGGLALAPVHRSASEWARAAGCDGLPAISQHSRGVELSTFKRCRSGDGVVLLYTLIGQGHVWPITSGNAGFSATRVILDFLQAHPRG